MKYVNNLLDVLILCILVTFSGLSAAQNFSEEDFYDDLPVILSASRLEQPLIESPSSVTVIDREMIANSGAREIKDLFRLVPGFQVYSYQGNIPIVTYHGLSEQYSRRLQVLINGRSAYEPSFGGVFWSDLPYEIEDIERIEVIRGPNAALYGANSFSAVINITTRAEASTNESKLVTRKGQQNINDVYINHTGHFGKTEYTLSGSFNEDDGFKNVTDGKQSNRFNTLFNTELSTLDSITFEAGLLKGTRGLGSHDSTINIPREKDVEAKFVRAKWNHATTDGDNFYLQFFTQKHETLDQYNINSTLDLNIPFPPFFTTIPVNTHVNFNLKSEKQEVEIQYTPQTYDHYQYVLGASVRKETVTAPFLLDTRHSRELKQSRVFANLAYHLSEKWLLNTGLMIENNDIVDTTLSPKVTLIYKIKNTQALRFTVSRATRTPVLFEEYAFLEYTLSDIPPPFGPEIVSLEGQSSGNLDKETITSTELGYHTYFNRNTSDFNIKLFHEKIDSLISQTLSPSTLSVDGDAFDFANTDNIIIQGIEASIAHQYKSTTHFSAGYTYAEASSDNIGNEYTETVPKHTVFAFVSHKINQYANISLGYSYYSTINGLDSSLSSDFKKLDLRYRYTFNPNFLNAELSFVIQNIHDNSSDYARNNVTDTTHYLEFKFYF